jgi:predicted ester cyclase
LSGRHGDTFLGVPATGVEIAMPSITIMHVRDARCVERWSHQSDCGR